MKKSLLLMLAAMFFMASCQKESANLLPEDSKMEIIKPEKSAVDAQSVEQAKSDLIKILQNRNNQLGKTGKTSSELNLGNNADYLFNKELISSLINPEDYQCSPTFMDYYVFESIQDWTDGDFLIYALFGNMTFEYVYIFDNENGGTHFGSEGQFTNAINRTYKDLNRFWDIPTDIVLRDAHGSFYNESDKVALIATLYGFPYEDAVMVADLLKIVFGSDAFMNFNHPLLTFNAFAAQADPWFGTPKKIVMGDGILQAFADTGFGDVAPQAILAHEYAHQVQFANNYNFEYSPEGTRASELMADYLAAYFMTHKRGATMNWKRVKQFLTVFYGIGDCSFADESHHGTPLQRLRAAQFGYLLASEAQVQGHILTSAEVISKFEEVLPVLIAADNN